MQENINRATAYFDKLVDMYFISYKVNKSYTGKPNLRDSEVKTLSRKTPLSIPLGELIRKCKLSYLVVIGNKDSYKCEYEGSLLKVTKNNTIGITCDTNINEIVYSIYKKDTVGYWLRLGVMIALIEIAYGINGDEFITNNTMRHLWRVVASA
jgi:hypothetical protein